MQLTPQAVDAAFFAFELRWQAAFAKAPTYYDKFADVVPSSGRETRYTFLDKLPQMREWLGERQIVNEEIREYTLVNRDWELTLELDRNVIMDDQIGMFNSTVDMLGMQARLLPDQLAVDMFVNGQNSDVLHTGFDGQPFFSANHPIQPSSPSSSVQSNYFTGTPFNATNWTAVRATMAGYLGNDLRPLAVAPSLTITPTGITMPARQAFNTTIIAPSVAFGINAGAVAQSNPLVGMSDILEWPYLTSQSAYYLADMKSPVAMVTRPWFYQNRLAPQFVYLNRADSIPLFMRKKFIYGTDARAAFGASLYFLMAKATA